MVTRRGWGEGKYAEVGQSLGHRVVTDQRSENTLVAFSEYASSGLMAE